MIKDPSPYLPGNPFKPNGFSQPGHAQAEATMALVFEQRTATLVAALNTEVVPQSARAQVLAELLNRLGIEQQEPEKKNLDALDMF